MYDDFSDAQVKPGHEPSSRADYKIDLHITEEGHRLRNGPLAWASIVQKDPILRYLHGILLTEQLADTHHIDFASDESLITRIERFLLDPLFVFNSLDTFFSEVYLFLPILDQGSFTGEVTRILANAGNLELTKVDDLATLGILLVILRLVSLVFSTASDTSPYIASTAVDVAIECLRWYAFRNKVSMCVVQCGLFIRLYQRIAPEVCEGVSRGDTIVRHGMLVQMAYSIELHKRLDTLTLREENLRSKIWRTIVVVDLMEASVLGTPLAVKKEFYDTELLAVVKINKDSSNVYDISIERTVVLLNSVLLATTDLLSEIINQVSNLRLPIKFTTLCKLLTRLEDETAKAIGSLSDLTTPKAPKDDIIKVYTKTHRLKVFLINKIVLLSVYAHLLCFFEGSLNQELTITHMLKICVISIEELLTFSLTFSKGYRDILGSLGYLIVSTIYLQAMHRASFLSLSLLVRLKFHLRNYDKMYAHEEALHHATLKEATEKLELCFKQFIANISKFTDTYEYASKTVSLLRFIFQKVANHDIFEEEDFDLLGKVRYPQHFLQAIITVTSSVCERVKVPLNELQVIGNLPIEVDHNLFDPQYNDYIISSIAWLPSFLEDELM